jgi:hypothetical protein
MENFAWKRRDRLGEQKKMVGMGKMIFDPGPTGSFEMGIVPK